MTTSAPERRWLPEWHAQDGVLLAWPAIHTDWADTLEAAQRCYRRLIDAFLDHADVVLVVPDEATADALARSLAGSRFRFTPVTAPYDDTWVRDSGPLTVADAAGLHWLDFRFDGWGGKFDATRDDRLTAHLATHEAFAKPRLVPFDWVLEGGAVDGDGAGTVLTTRSVVRARYPGLAPGLVEQRLAAALGAERILVIEHGEIEGDDTDGHIDILVRFANREALVFQGCRDADDPHHAALQAMSQQLETFSDGSGAPYRLHELPFPPAIHDDEGRRLGASYANFLILNDAVFVPTYGVDTDRAALAVLGAAFPRHRIVDVDCRILITQGGSLHCATMQLPAGCLA
ncbi:MAG: agmatine deiminase family protein [Pseudomonadota bacterium]